MSSFPFTPRLLSVSLSWAALLLVFATDVAASPSYAIAVILTTLLLSARLGTTVQKVSVLVIFLLYIQADVQRIVQNWFMQMPKESLPMY